jgi:hypothetical protein
VPEPNFDNNLPTVLVTISQPINPDDVVVLCDTPTNIFMVLREGDRGIVYAVDGGRRPGEPWEVKKFLDERAKHV